MSKIKKWYQRVMSMVENQIVKDVSALVGYVWVLTGKVEAETTGDKQGEAKKKAAFDKVMAQLDVPGGLPGVPSWLRGVLSELLPDAIEMAVAYANGDDKTLGNS